MIKRVVLVFLFLLTGCIKPISDRVEEQPATAKQPVEKLAYVADRALWLTTLGGTDKQKIDACRLSSAGQFDLKSGQALPLIDKARLLSLTPNAEREHGPPSPGIITWRLVRQLMG